MSFHPVNSTSPDLEISNTIQVNWIEKNYYDIIFIQWWFCLKDKDKLYWDMWMQIWYPKYNVNYNWINYYCYDILKQYKWFNVWENLWLILWY